MRASQQTHKGVTPAEQGGVEGVGVGRGQPLDGRLSGGNSLEAVQVRTRTSLANGGSEKVT